MKETCILTLIQVHGVIAGISDALVRRYVFAYVNVHFAVLIWALVFTLTEYGDVRVFTKTPRTRPLTSPIFISQQK